MNPLLYDPRTYFRLSHRETEVMRLLSSGLCNQEIATSLNISLQTAKNTVTNIFRKMNVSNRVAAIIRFSDNLSVTADQEYQNVIRA